MQAASQLTRDSLLDMPLMLIGTPASNPWIDSLAPALPFEWKMGQFRFRGLTLAQPGQSLQLSFYPHPWQPHQALLVLTGLSDSAVLGRLADRNTYGWGGLPWNGWDYQVHDEGRRVLLGQFDGDWQADPAREWRFAEIDRPTLRTPHFHWYVHEGGPEGERLRQLADSAEARARRLAAFLGNAQPTFPVAYHAYGSAEHKGLLMANMERSHLVPADREVHVIHHSAYGELPPLHELTLLLRDQLGEAAHPGLETGLLLQLLPTYLRDGYRAWAGRLARSGNALSLAQLWASPEDDAASSLVVPIMAGAWVSWLLDRWGREEFLARYGSWQPESVELAALESDWQAYLQKLAITAPPVPKRQPKLPYFKGMTLAHEGYQVYNGYGSRLSAEALDSLQALQVNAVAIVPYTGSRSVSEPVPYGFFAGPGSENDASIVETLAQTRTRDMWSLLKPQIWFRGHWPGAVKMQSEADWAAFMGHYRRWIRHYAILAEVYGADLFCVGVEFVEATLAQPKAWRSLVGDMRQLYGGPVTYAANWGQEAEQLGFAEALDVVGVNCYYPLSESEQPTQEELEEAWSRIEAKMQALTARTGKPVVLTEIGFRSVTAPWQAPHAEAGEQTYDEQAQARAYRLVLNGLRGQAWCGGLFWWKWPTYLAYSERNPRSFTPAGKAAQAVLREAYAAPDFPGEKRRE